MSIKEASVGQNDARSADPFNIYDLLSKKQDDNNKGSSVDDSLKYPPGYTPTDAKDATEEHYNKSNEPKRASGHFQKAEIPRSGGSILQLMDNLVKMGQIVGYNMEGCMKNIEEIIESQGGNEETKMVTLELFCIKRCWGKFAFDYVYSASVGNSGEILYVWDPKSFQKLNVTVLDYFVMIRGVWVPNGEVVIMGDFNKVRKKAKRFGSVFNVQGANAFNLFFSNVGLEESMSSRPNMSAITLDRYLSDYRPILMRESHYNYGPVPFRFFHYWFEMEGFDKFVEESWKEALVAKANALIKMMKKLKYLKEKIGVWNKTNKESPNNSKRNLKDELAKLDSAIDKGEGDGDCNPCHFVRSECSNLVI
ncbi:hypothetical protein Tco_1268825 [Tanacetum coccineum]